MGDSLLSIVKNALIFSVSLGQEEVEMVGFGINMGHQSCRFRKVLVFIFGIPFSEYSFVDAYGGCSY